MPEARLARTRAAYASSRLDALAEEAKARHHWRRSTGIEVLAALERDGFTVQRMTDYHFRVNNAVDIYPTNRRYHVLSTNMRGGYRDTLALVRLVKTLLR